MTAEEEAMREAAGAATLGPSEDFPEEGDMVLAVGTSKFNEDVVHREAGVVNEVDGIAVHFENERGSWSAAPGEALFRGDQELTRSTEVYLLSLWDPDGVLGDG